MSSRVIECEDEHSLCGSTDCTLRFECFVHGVKDAKVAKKFEPRTELVIAGGNPTLTCRDYSPDGLGDGVVGCGY